MKPILLNACIVIFVAGTCLAQPRNQEDRLAVLKIDRIVNQQMVANHSGRVAGD